MTGKLSQMNFADTLQILANDMQTTYLNCDTFMENKSQQNMFLPPTDPNEVAALFKLIKRKNSSGHDGISIYRNICLI